MSCSHYYEVGIRCYHKFLRLLVLEIQHGGCDVLKLCCLLIPTELTPKTSVDLHGNVP